MVSYYGGSASTLYALEVRGTEKLLGLLESVGGKDFMAAVAQSVYAEANLIMLEAKKIVPLDDGPLRASGTVIPPVTTGFIWEVTLGFGGAAEAYALIQHENLMFKHKPGRTAKYLENPVNDALPKIERNLGLRIEKYLSEKAGGI